MQCVVSERNACGTEGTQPKSMGIPTSLVVPATKGKYLYNILEKCPYFGILTVSPCPSVRCFDEAWTVPYVGMEHT